MILIKTCHGDITGFASGKRSAILQKGDDLLRFKGCGMYDRGFEVAVNEMFGTEEIRGSHYFFNSVVELYYSEKMR